MDLRKTPQTIEFVANSRVKLLRKISRKVKLCDQSLNIREISKLAMGNSQSRHDLAFDDARK